LEVAMKKLLCAGLVCALGLGLTMSAEAKLGRKKEKKPAPGVGADYKKNFTSLMSAPSKSESHENRFVSIYVNKSGESAYKALSAPLPEGTILAKESFKDEAGKPGALFDITVMKKLKKGSKPEAGDWYFAVLNPDGTTKEENPKRCIDCHAYSATDYVYGTPKK
jgi:hypothetical protein